VAPLSDSLDALKKIKLKTTDVQVCHFSCAFLVENSDDVRVLPQFCTLSKSLLHVYNIILLSP